MIPLRWLVFAIACLSASGFASAQEKDTYLSLQSRIFSLLKENKTSVVQVFAAIDKQNEKDKTLLLVGTGFFMSREGLVITNASVVYGADRVWLEYNGLNLAAEVVGHDTLTNISILRATNVPENFTYVKLTDSNEAPEVGTIVVGITRELGMQAGPAMGLITGLNISYGKRLLPAVYLRSDIASDGGEGGSPVFDLSGRFVGIMIASLPETRSSFILPAKALRRVRDDIIFSGEAKYAWFGLKATQHSDAKKGVFVEVDEVIAGSPAASTEVRPGDVLLQIGDFKIANEYDLRDATFYTPADKIVPLIVLRQGKELQFSMRVGIRPTTKPAGRIPASEVNLPAAETVVKAPQKEELQPPTPVENPVNIPVVKPE